MAQESQVRMFPHSEVKVRLLRLYLERYLNVLTQSGWFNKVYVYDLFCGEGYYEDGGKGSPIAILETIGDIHKKSLQTRGKTGHFDCQFNDLDASKVTRLEWAVNDKKLFTKEMGDISFTKDDYAVVLPKVISKVDSLKKEKAFVFIDPYGYKDISIKHICSLLRNGNTEVLLFLPTQFMFRFEQNGTPESLNKFINELVPIDKWPKSETGIDFIDTLLDAFRNKVGPDRFVDSFIITRDKNQFFCLFFFTSHIYGFDRMLDAKWEIDAEEGRGWQYEEENLFSNQKKTPNTIKFEKALKQYLKGTFRTNGEVYEFTIKNYHLTSHTIDILMKAQKDGVLEVLTLDNKQHRNGSFGINYKEYRDSPGRLKMKIK